MRGMEKYIYQFTVFTCCYNGAHTIHRVIETLKRQTFRNFEWIILNNGSTDNLDDIINLLISENVFPIKYLSQYPNNYNVAQNIGVSNAEGEYFIPLNADDTLVDNALEVFYDVYQKFPKNMQNEICGIVCNCMDQNGNFIGTPFPINNTVPVSCLLSNELDMRYKYKVVGEKYGFIKTDIRREFFYNTEVDSYTPDILVWFSVGEKYKFACINETLRIYYINDNEGSAFTRDFKEKKYMAGAVFYIEEVINKYIEKMNLPFLNTLKLYINLSRYSMWAKIRISDSIGHIKKLHKRIFAYICVPLAFLFYLIHK
jgi:glycosyltransferase involved in cell wall biosynthesis